MKLYKPRAGSTYNPMSTMYIRILGQDLKSNLKTKDIPNQIIKFLTHVPLKQVS